MRLTERAHLILNGHLKEGDFVIDATAGNGHDTLFLASRVGATGRVVAIDIQAAAVTATRERLTVHGKTARSTVIEGNHGEILTKLAETENGTVSAIIFNLGYLPGSDKTVQTKESTTLQAFEAAKKLIRPKGLLMVTAYRGHPGGQEEAEAVEKWMTALPADGWSIQNFEPETTRMRVPPILWVAEHSL